MTASEMTNTHGSTTKAGLSATRRKLLERMQRTNFGRLELRIQGGEPVFEPPPRVIQDVKLGGGENGPDRS